MGTLYLVGTPIGNLEDITLRAVRVLKEVSLIAAEDTRRARILLTHYGITTPTISYFEHSKLARQEQILSALEQGDVALISEAGMPGISDPGYQLIQEAIQRGFAVTPIPGPSALLCALVVSGLPTDSFVFLGFLPRRRQERQRTLAGVRAERRTLIVYEAPHRLLSCLQDMWQVLGDRPIAVARELTKLHEEVYRGSVAGALAHFTEFAPRGEFVLVVQGTVSDLDKPVCEADHALELARQLCAEGFSAREAAIEAARRTGADRRWIYQQLHT
jgi:16S rRNA (cytidine1402-2'-O)-methyltransferase